MMEIRFYSPAEMNGTAATRHEQEIIVMAPGGMVYGPYCPLEAGDYAVDFAVALPTGGSVRLDVLAGDAVLAETTAGASGRVTLNFTLDAPIHPVEFRTFNTGAPGQDAVFFGVTLTRSNAQKG